MSGALRAVELVLDGPPTPAWQARALAELRSSHELHVATVRHVAPPQRSALRRAHEAIERRLIARTADALAPGSAASAATDVAEGGERAGNRALVVWLAEGAQPSAADGRELLYIRHDGAVEPAEESFRRAALSGGCFVTSELVLQAPDRGEVEMLLARTRSGVRRYAPSLSRDLALWKLASTVVRAAERVAADASPDERVAAQPSLHRPRAASTARQAAGAPVVWTRVFATRLLFRRPWSIRVRERTAQFSPTSGWAGAASLVRWRAGHVYADPFLFECDGRHHLFCEEVPLGAKRALISHTELRLDGTLAAAPEPVLSEPHHLSYPFVFAHDGDVYMVPESSATRRVELYRALDFPHEWQRQATLLADVSASDATLLEHDGHLWLFVAIAAEHATTLDELHLFGAERLAGPWTAHPGNPVVSDVRCARPAGAIAHWGERLVRPGQDGSRRYGGAVSFREIDVLSTTHYAEHEVARLDAAAVGARATHTYNADSRFEAIDLRQRELRIRSPIAQLAGRLAGARRRAQTSRVSTSL